MPETITPIARETPAEPGAFTQTAHALAGLVLTMRHYKGVVAAVMAAAVGLGAVYYFGSTRRYESRAALLVTQSGGDALDTSMTGEESVRRNSMPTFSNMIHSAKVTEAAIENLAPEDCADFEGLSRDQWAQRLQDNLSSSVVRSTSILEVSYRSKNPKVAANVVHAVVHAYVTFMDRMHKGAAAEISEILIKERKDVADQLAVKQAELLEARRSFSDLGMRGEGKVSHPLVQRAVAFNEALVQVQKQRVEYETALAALRLAVEREEDLSPHLMTIANLAGQELVLGSLGMGLGSREIGAQAALEESLLRDQAEYATLQRHLGPQHPELAAVSERIRNAQRLLDSYPDRATLRMSDERRRQLGPWLLRLAAEKLDETRFKERMLLERFEAARSEAISLTGQMARIELLERDLKRLGDMNDILLNQLASIDLKRSGQAVRVAVIAEPKVSKTPVSPRLSRTLLAIVALGAGCAVVLVNLMDALDDRFRSPEEIETRLRSPLLAIVGDLEGDGQAGCESLCAVRAPFSSENESFRTLRSAIALRHPNARQLLVTSAAAGDGKTTVSANLAACYALANKRTLLIDADMRKPGMTTLMKMRGLQGLSDILQAADPVAALASGCVQLTQVKGFDVLPSGARPRDAAELLSGERFSQLLAWAEGRYDQILIDAPPALLVSDAAIMGRLVDAVLLVARPATSRRHAVSRLVDTLNWMNIPLLGVVANRVSATETFSYSAYGYGYGYGYGDGHDDGGERRIQSEDTADETAEDSRPGPSRAA